MLRAHSTGISTLGANAVKSVIRIVNGQTVFRLRRPIDLEVRQEGPWRFVEYQPLGLEGRGRAEEDALESFADQFRGMWEWLAASDDSQLTKDARQIKRRIRNLVESVSTAP